MRVFTIHVSHYPRSHLDRISRVLRAARNGIVLLRHGYWQEVLHSVRERMSFEGTYLGLCHDLSSDLPPVDTRIDVTVRPLWSEETLTILDEDTDGAATDLRTRLARWQLLRTGLRTPYVAVTSLGEPCYLQWVIQPEDFPTLQRITNSWYPPLAEGEILLEGAFTFESFRGRGVAVAAVIQLVEEATRLGAKRLITYIARDNIAALKAYERLGFTVCLQRHERWWLFHRRLTSVPTDSSITRAPYPAAAHN